MSKEIAKPGDGLSEAAKREVEKMVADAHEKVGNYLQKINNEIQKTIEENK